MINNIRKKEIVKKTINDIDYYFYDDKTRNCLQMHLILNVGSNHDGPSAKGAAHFVEHMCLGFSKGRAVEHIITISGYTSYDETVYTVRLDSGIANIYSCLKLFQKIIEGSNINSAQFEEIRKEIISEWYEQYYGSYFSERNSLYAQLLPKYLIENLPIGDLAYIESVSFDELLNFHRVYYSSASIAIMFNGDLSALYMDDILERFSNHVKRLQQHQKSQADLVGTNLIQQEQGSIRNIKITVNETDSNIICNLYFRELYWRSKKNQAFRNEYYSLGVKLFSLSIIDFLLQQYFDNQMPMLEGILTENRIDRHTFLMSYEYILSNNSKNKTLMNSLECYLKKNILVRDNIETAYEENKDKLIHDIKDMFVEIKPFNACRYNFLYSEPLNFNPNEFNTYLFDISIGDILDYLEHLTFVY